jgi:hypothetical protein
VLGLDDKFEETDCSIDSEIKIGNGLCSIQHNYTERCWARAYEGKVAEGALYNVYTCK